MFQRGFEMIIIHNVILKYGLHMKTSESETGLSCRKLKMLSVWHAVVNLRQEVIACRLQQSLIFSPLVHIVNLMPRTFRCITGILETDADFEDELNSFSKCS